MSVDISKDLQNFINNGYEKDGFVDIVKVAKHLGISVYGANLSDNQNSFIIKNKEKDIYEIYVEKNHCSNRQRFSIAHEIAHFLLHKDDIDKNEKIARNHIDSLDYKKEKEADFLAGSLLVPKDKMKAMIKGKKIDDNLIDYLSKEFKVSKGTIVYRFSQLNYHIPFYWGM